MQLDSEVIGEIFVPVSSHCVQQSGDISRRKYKNITGGGIILILHFDALRLCSSNSLNVL